RGVGRDRRPVTARRYGTGGGHVWADFYSDLSHAFARDQADLRGRRIILTQDMRLRSASGAGPVRRAGRDRLLPSRARRHRGRGETATRVPGDLKALRRRISFTHPAITWDPAGRGFLERNELVRPPYQLDRVFDALDDLLAGHPSEALRRDALTFAFRQYPLAHPGPAPTAGTNSLPAAAGRLRPVGESRALLLLTHLGEPRERDGWTGSSSREEPGSRPWRHNGISGSAAPPTTGPRRSATGRTTPSSSKLSACVTA
ncbi:hypothetical protein GTV15_21730, partial [Streptomyces sp. SID7803]|nr:hypothetical protein [Streptomyces sp. SID7803]